MKYVSAAVVGLLVFSGILLSTCEKRQTDIYAVVNGINVKAADFITDENRNDENKQKEDLFALIEKMVINGEAQKLSTTPEELLGFFDSLKTRDIKDIEKIFKAEFKDQSLGPQSRDQMLNAVREKQYDLARKKYIYELKNRSTILLVDDDGVFHTYKPELN